MAATTFLVLSLGATFAFELVPDATLIDGMISLVSTGMRRLQQDDNCPVAQRDYTSCDGSCDASCDSGSGSCDSSCDYYVCADAQDYVPCEACVTNGECASMTECDEYYEVEQGGGGALGFLLVPLLVVCCITFWRRRALRERMRVQTYETHTAQAAAVAELMPVAVAQAQPVPSTSASVGSGGGSAGAGAASPWPKRETARW